MFTEDEKSDVLVPGEYKRMDDIFSSKDPTSADVEWNDGLSSFAKALEPSKLPSRDSFQAQVLLTWE